MLLTHETEVLGRGRVEELEKMAKHHKREAEKTLEAAHAKLAEADKIFASAQQQRQTAKRMLEDAKMGADWKIDFLSKKRVRHGVTEYKVVWTPTWESEHVLTETASKSIEEFEAADALIAL
jgi:hypothetical protein